MSLKSQSKGLLVTSSSCRKAPPTLGKRTSPRLSFGLAKNPQRKIPPPTINPLGIKIGKKTLAVLTTPTPAMAISPKDSPQAKIPSTLPFPTTTASITAHTAPKPPVSSPGGTACHIRQEKPSAKAAGCNSTAQRQRKFATPNGKTAAPLPQTITITSSAAPAPKTPRTKGLASISHPQLATT